MTKFAATSKDTVSSTDTASSGASSDLFDLERDIPMTEEDIRVQRELRRQPGKNLLPYIDELLNPLQFENIAPRRTTSAGWEPFRLDFPIGSCAKKLVD